MTSENRADPSYARQLLESYLPEPESRHFFLQLLADLIQLAHQESHSSWGVTLREDGRVQLNVGSLACLYIKDQVKLFWLHEDGIEEPTVAGKSLQAFDRVPLSRSYAWTPEKVQPWAAKLRRQIEALARTCAQQFPTLWITSQKKHSSGVLRYLEEELGITLPNPQYPLSTRETQFWRVGTREGAERLDRWPIMLKGSFVSIGWSGLGDLSELIAGCSEQEGRQVLKERLLEQGATEGNVSRYASQWYQYVTEMQVDDVVVAMDGQYLLGIGRVSGDYEFVSEDTEQSHHHAVDWVWKGRELWEKHPGSRTTLYNFTHDPAAVQHIQNYLGQDNATQNRPTMTPKKHALNTILYGPPGTGKTYETARRAVEIIEGSAPNDRKELMKRYRELQRKGRIGFVTFHQSYAYEDFIEGIRPVMDEEAETSGTPRYQIVDGILKEIVGMALKAPLVDNLASESIWDEFLRLIKNNPATRYQLGSNRDKKDYEFSINSRGNVNYRTIDIDGYDVNEKDYSVNKDKLIDVWECYYSRDRINASDARRVTHQFRPVYAVVFNILKAMSGGKFEGDRSYRNAPRYVLIVDEINRGNISKILGELITLLEDDKRIGEDNELTVTLPYSRQPFALPPNLYLIGTMNTADKSLALLDVALRRRFTFEELTPDFDVCGLAPEMRKALDELNRRIMLRKDRDHRIGHAFFMNVGTDSAAFNRAFTGKVLPLLQEYFFNDWEGLRYVLGEKGFIVELEGGQAKEARNRWQWYTDAGMAVNPLEQLRENYGLNPSS